MSSTQSDHVSGLNQKALLDLATDPADNNAPRSYRLPTIAELSEQFPDLEILELLGTGGMGCVFKARQKKLDRVVAIKILPRELARDDLFAERFSREARAMARLDHPNIVAIYDFGQNEDMYYLTMQYMDGMNLRELIEAKALDPNEALGVFTQVAKALAFAHGEGVVHRDIKPENILFDKQGHVALADFGLARLAMDTNCEISLTATRQAMGTLNYMAPEQYENPKAVDHRADIYAMGVLLYELITGRIPRGSFPPASSICPTGPRVDHVINKALQVTPDHRYASLEDMLIAISKEAPEFEVTANMLGNGTFTNFMNIGAAPFRYVGKTLADGQKTTEGTRTWIPLHKLTYFAIGVVCLLLCFPWHQHDPRPGWFESDELPLLLILPMLGVLSQLAKFRHKLHPIRWFILCFLCFMGLFTIVLEGHFNSSIADIYLGMIAYLAFEFGFFVLDALGRKFWALANGSAKRSR